MNYPAPQGRARAKRRPPTKAPNITKIQDVATTVFLKTSYAMYGRRVCCQGFRITICATPIAPFTNPAFAIRKIEVPKALECVVIASFS